MPLVHHCHFCGHRRAADSATVLTPACDGCGAALHAVEESVADRDLADGRGEGGRTAATTDAGGLIALLVVVPWLLPLVGVRLGDLVFLVPLVVLLFAAERCLHAARIDAGRTLSWRVLAANACAAAVACAIAILAAVLWPEAGILAFYAGAAASAGLLAGLALRLPAALRSARLENIVDAALVILLVAAATTFFVVIPGFDRGDVTLTAVVIVDLVALVLAALCAVTRGRRRGKTDSWLCAAAVCVLAGDGLVALGAAGLLSATGSLTALLWAGAAWSIACAADHATDRADTATAPDDRAGWRWILGRLVLPLAAVLTFPAIAGGLALAGELPGWGLLFWTACTVAALALAFGRQAWLLLERQQAVLRERALTRTAHRRNDELEALTALATTMTSTLEEAPIVEQALRVVHEAAGASSTALHVIDGDDGLALHATTGDWSLEHGWAGSPYLPASSPEIELRGRRRIVRLVLAARGRTIGVLTVIRGQEAPFEPDHLRLLTVLVDEMALAVQNARDYRERLEQAIRDPLTGAYNRRFMLEAMEKEVQRSERYGSEASLVIFDVDDFKSINDTHGHAAGDAVLRRLAEIAHAIVRPADSFARVGGEEFALLLPETTQLQALLVAERVRTAIARQTILPDRRVTISGGVASCPADALTSEELTRKADGALYWAKRNGKDLCAVASEVRGGDEAADPGDGVLAHLYALVAMIDGRHQQTRDHSENVASYAVAIGQELGLEPERIVRLRRAAMLHDIGKVTVSESILNKPAKLSDEEFALIQSHAPMGGEVLAHAGLEEEAHWVRCHHERFDGRGYPDGLAGEAIPLEARIIFVADSFEAMTSDRPYRNGMPVADAMAEIRRCTATQFDPVVVRAFEALVQEDRLAVLALRAQDAA